MRSIQHQKTLRKTQKGSDGIRGCELLFFQIVNLQISNLSAQTDETFTRKLLVNNFIIMQIKIQEYRNGIYQGSVKAGKRNGAGILITDDGQIFIGEWKNDLLFGKGLVFLSHEEYGFGDFNRGELEGFFLFRAKQKTFFSEFNMSRPINKMVLLDHDKDKSQIIIHKSPIFQVISEKAISSEEEGDQIFNCIGVKHPAWSLLEYLEKQLCEAYPQFKNKSLNNGNILFYYDEQANPSSLGFVLNKNEQLVSFGVYVNDRLTGMGCKLENTVRYEGMFENGFMNGIGLKHSQGKYSFGQFENGNLMEALYIEDRSNLSEDKLKDFKKSEHLRSIWHTNAYVKKNLMRFRGMKELVFEINVQQEYMYPQTKAVKKSTPIKNLAIKMIRRDQFETKSSKSFLVRPNKNPEDDDAISQSNTNMGLSGLRKFKY